MNVNHGELNELIRTSYETRLPLFIWGAVGIGKSQAVRQAAKDLAKKIGKEYSENGNEEAFRMIERRVSQMEPSDMLGLPTFNDDKSQTKWIAPNWLPRKGTGILFLDELNLAPPSIQSACYQLILDRRVGDYILPEGFIVLAAGNRMEDRANVFDIPAPLANRFLHCELMLPSIEEWTDWALINDIDSKIIAFLQFKPIALHMFDKNIKDKSFPTPRTWAGYANKLMQAGQEKFIASAIGEGIASEFEAFLKLQKTIDYNQILENPKMAEKVKEIDMLFVLVGGLAEKVRNDTKKFENGINVTMHLPTEYGILLLRMIKAVNQPYFMANIQKVKNWKEIWEKYGKYLTGGE